MEPMFIIRLAIAVLIIFVLFYQARQLVNQPNRKRAFLLGAAALLCFTIFNVSIGLNIELGPIQQLLALAGVLLFIGVGISMVLSMRNGEHRAASASASAQAQAYAEQRKKARAEKPNQEQ